MCGMLGGVVLRAEASVCVGWRRREFCFMEMRLQNIRLPSQAVFEFTKVSRGQSASFHCL